jgi:two-component system cell cycle sensor histidine kinase/response regulator CckA
MTDEKYGARPGAMFILRYFGAAIMVSAFATLFYFYYSAYLHRQLDENNKKLLETQANVFRILRLDELRTLSVGMAAAGGGPEYERRYEQAVLELESLTKRTAQLLPGKETDKFIKETAEANARMLQLERAALARKRIRSEALFPLNNADYLKWKEAYANNVDELSHTARTTLSSGGEMAHGLFKHELLVNACLLALAGASWLLSLVILRRRSLEAGLASLLLREKEDDYRRFFDNVHEIFYRTDMRGILTKITPSVYRLAGYTPEECLGTPATAMYESPEDRKKFLKELIKKGNVVDYLVRLKSKHRGVVPISVNASLIRGPGGIPIAIEGTLRDISERIIAEEALKQRNDQMEALIQNSPAAIIPVDREDKVLMWNKAAERMFGWTAAEVVGKPNPVVPEDKKEEFRSVLGGILCGAPVFDLETQRLKKDGALLDVILSAIPMRGKSGETESVMSFMTDITARKRLEESLREGQRALATLLGNLPGMAYRCRHDENWTMEFLSEGCAELTGYPPAALLGSARTSYNSLISPQDRDGVKKTVNEALAEKRPYELAYHIHAADGRIKWVWEKGRGVFSATGELEALEGFIADITDRKSVEEQLEHTRDHLRQVQKMEAVGRLAGGVAHDFNNLLTAILSYAGMVSSSLPLSDPRLKDMAEITRAGERAAALTHQLLAFSRRQVLLPKVISLNDTVRGLESMLRRLIGENIELSLNLAPDLPSIKADPGQVEQVVMNLAVNARDAMPEGGKIIIETDSAELDETAPNHHDIVPPGKYVRLIISDTGTGMDTATLAHIFEPFYTTKTTGKNTGLGLSTVYGIVKQSNGFIWVYSEPGGGCSFKIYLPPAAGAPESAGAVSDATPEKGTGTIMLVEDEELVRTPLARILRGNGYTVIEACNGEEAAGLGAETFKKTGLLLTDLVMPGMGGLELAARATAISPGIKVIFMSGYSEALAKAKDNIRGAFLQKPLTAGMLLSKVRETLHGRTASNKENGQQES